MRIINLTQHNATLEQTAAGVFEPADKKKIQELLTFNELPNKLELMQRSKALAEMAKASGAEAAMIGGAPYFMPWLDLQLEQIGVTPIYAFSVRESIEKMLPDGTVQKVNVFKHKGFVGLN